MIAETSRSAVQRGRPNVRVDTGTFRSFIGATCATRRPHASAVHYEVQLHDQYVEGHCPKVPPTAQKDDKKAHELTLLSLRTSEGAGACTARAAVREAT